jgi:phosphatidylglycerophosphate synthase
VFDALVRPWIDPPLQRVGRRLHQAGISADAVTVAGLVVGLLAALAIALRHDRLGLGLLLASRLLDGLDGAIARAATPTDRGAYLDIASDYVFYVAVPLAFAVTDPARNALAAAALLASFTLTGTSFLAFATLAAKRGLETALRGKKSFFYSFGLMEGTETIACFAAMSLWPSAFPGLAWAASALCVATFVQRAVLALRTFR